jgi:hypothetical protein
VRKKANMSDDQRKDARIGFHLEVRIKDHEGQYEIKDLSLSGLFIGVEDPYRFKEGTEIDLIMELPYENDPIMAKAKIMRVTMEGIGVEFVDMRPQHAIALEYCFHLFKHTVPMPDNG